MWSLLPLLLPTAQARCLPDTPELAEAPRVLAEAEPLDAAEVAWRLAPTLSIPWAEAPERRAWDLPAAVDFDGNTSSRDNRESLLSGAHAILPTLYYAVAETETHVYVSYHAFHPLDWAEVPGWLRVSATHENDGENLQVVARKTSEGLVVEWVALQAHARTTFAATAFAPAPEHPRVRSTTITLDEAGRPRVLMESGGHGLWPLEEPAAELDTITLKPGAPLTQPGPEARVGSYRLLSTVEAFPLSADGELLDASFRACDPLSDSLRPAGRHYDSDYLAAPGRRDAGISPYAIGRRLVGPPRWTWLGAFWFDPAASWWAALGLEPDADWSLSYLSHPVAEG
ncbi:MAG: hypothetical protein H6741_19610 [Alphaproteobacteria bacterium]|nr:hypothetical protein [Alphaproteobacteria bacterium]